MKKKSKKVKNAQNVSSDIKKKHDVELNGHNLSVEMSRKTAKAGRLIIRNLAFGATAKHVRKAFAKVGELADVHLPLKPGVESSASGGSPAHRGFAFVQFADAAVAERAVSELNGTKICGRGVAVDFAMDNRLYEGLLREEEQSQQNSTKKGETDGKDKEPAKMKPKKSSSKDEEQESEDDDDEGEEEEVAEASDEVRRMKDLLGDEVEDPDPKEAVEEKVKKEQKSKDSKDKRKPGYDVGEGRTLFVRNCPFDATEQEVRQAFGKFGKVASVKFVADRSGENKHSGSMFIKFREAEGLQKALAVEADADRKLKELASVIKRSEQRDLAAVEGFGVSLHGRRLVLKEALSPGEVQKAGEERKPEKGKAAKERSSWMHLLHIGEINDTHEGWGNLSKSEKRQRQASMKERKWRVNNSNFAIHPQRLSIRNLPRSVDATKVREVLVHHLAEQSFLQDAGKKKERLKQAQLLVTKIGLVRDAERRTEQKERRSKGFGFINLKDHRSAMASLELLNDNPDIFGGGKRPIVEFAIEDKRKLRMQEELYAKHAHKLLATKEAPEQGKGKGNGKGKGKDAGQDDNGKGKGKGKGKEAGQDGSAKGKGKGDSFEKFKLKHKKKAGESRGRRQREKKRALKAAAEEKAKNKAVFEEKMERSKQRKAVEHAANRTASGKRQKRNEPDARPTAKKSKHARPGELTDDFELRAMERFRSGLK